ncbi:dihydrofolate reductase [Sinobacterium caligoides]|uniref:Dihydrofolate reductase n=1 Tax=Sinobacterium caligoides TaxID=933926 RepID=A0A3N2DHI0_9GAMM|nr:dihydrofolate reductase [Sinobacterium caligoides]ROR98844.1 dihydrofolate reductase [Sinobacterium caligoides]
MKLSLIVAMADNGVIGRNNKLPWHLPNDLKYFRSVTMGKPIVMGRKTFESIGKALPGRTNIVVSRNPDFSAEGIRVVDSLFAALTLAESIAVIDGSDELMLIGGAQLYRESLAQADCLYLTKVHSDVIEGDAFFPPIDWQQWSEGEVTHHEADDNNPYAYSFCVYTRRR